jgi:hypothetical protein
MAAADGTQLSRRWLALGAVAGGLLLGGCADSGFDLNGKVFDWMGVSASALAAKKDEPKLAERAPLVLPPNSTRLPEPGSGKAPQQAMAWPDDEEQRAKREAQERQRLHDAYCRGDVQWKDRVMNPEDVNTPRSPYGPCAALFGDLNSNVKGLSKDGQKE